MKTAARRIRFSRQTCEAHIRERIRKLEEQYATAAPWADVAALRGRIDELKSLLEHWEMKP